MEIEDIWKTRKTEKKKGGESIWRREIAFVEEKNKEEGEKCLEKENIWRTKIYVACKDEGIGRNIWRSVWSLEEKKNGEGKSGKYLKKEK